MPTANLRCDDQLIPADAVYAGRCNINGKPHPAAVSIGTMPTFGENVRQIEAHLIGFDGDLYGATLTVELVDWLREQRAYRAVDSLKAQIHTDIALAVATAANGLARPIAISFT